MNESGFSPVYCTWTYRKQLPADLRSQFRDLDGFLRELIASATARLLIVAPYLSPAGLITLRDAIAVASDHGAWLRLLTGDLDDPDGLNRRAVMALCEGERGATVRNRLRLLTPTPAWPTFLHAKLIVVDGTHGYLGSANISRSAMETNFEVGTALAPTQARALDALVAYLESHGMVEDCTERFFVG